MAGTAFGLSTPIAAHTASLFPWGLSPYSSISVNPFMSSQFTGPSALQTTQGPVLNPYATLPQLQIQQLAQIVPQQLQQLLQLEYLLQHQLQQLLQVIPVQLAHLQQLVQSASPLQQQPMTAAGFPSMTPWGVAPQLLGPQSGYVM